MEKIKVGAKKFKLLKKNGKSYIRNKWIERTRQLKKKMMNGFKSAQIKRLHLMTDC
jgi:hypothetical protein